ncbi:hypothetical protein [Arthrobacter sp. PsM3]|uniref:hypothetical protein n=1 Tax=Arthrobacter sp. PsM3 TaxID=3030531 RepID=UPI00263ACD47|nr:hypothetical protein [Arthrobacter sp. PsM3]MDN4643406.1 hypothetical protein [Arthrobacter sp. PsM3]
MNDPRQTARNLIEQYAITLHSLWIRYWIHGGTATLFDFDTYLYEVKDPSPADFQSLALAMEALEDPEGHETEN